MSETIECLVLREHSGDRYYKRGEVRLIMKSDAVNLINLGVLDPVTIDNKAVSTAPENKKEKLSLNRKGEK